MRILSNVNILGTLDLDNVQNAAADTDRFLVQDANGVVKFRTGAEVASDIGASVGYVSTVKHEVKLGEAIAKGQAVYVTSADGTNMIVSKASNASDATSSKTLGLLETGGSTNDKVFVITEGLLAGLDTSTAAAGDPVWLGTAGNLLYGLANKPLSPAHMVFIGIVTRVNANNGEIFVKVQNGFELEELHDVLITGTPVDKAVIQYDTASGLWKNSTHAGVIASGTTSQLLRGDGSLLTMPIVLTSPSNGQVLKFNGTNWVNDSDAGITGSGAAGQVAYFTGATTQSGSNNLFWDATNNRLGIGTNTPTAGARIHIAGTLGSILCLDNGAQINFTRDGNNAIDVTGGASAQLQIRATSNLQFHTGSTITERMRLFSNGNLALGSTTDNGLRFQVTGDGFFSGSVGIGATGITQHALRISKNIEGSTISYGASILSNVQSGVTSGARLFYTEVGTQAASFTLVELNHFYAVQGTFGAGSTVTNQYGFRVFSNLIGASINYGFYSDIPSGTGRWNFFANGTANNYMAGSLGIGTNALTGYNLRILKTMTGAGFPFNVSVAGAVQSDVTNTATYVQAISSTQATTFTLPQITLFSAEQGTFGAGSTVTNQVGFNVANLTGATNNFAFVGNIASGTGRWNLYMNGTADNYLAGSLGIGTTSIIGQIHARGGSGASVTPMITLSQNGDLGLDWAAGVLNFYSQDTSTNSAGGIGHIRVAAQAAYNTGTTPSYMAFYTHPNVANNNTALGATVERMRLDASGNLGLGVTPSAWGGTAFQTGVTGINNFGATTRLINNAYYTSGNSPIYIVSNFASSYEQVSGQHKWLTAASGTGGTGITFTQPMTLFATGNLAVGTTTDAGFRLDVNGTMRVSGASTFGAGATISNNSNNVVQITQNASSLSNNVYALDVNSSAHTANMSVSGAFIARVNSGVGLVVNGFGNVGIGIAVPAFKLDVQGTIGVTGAATFSSTVTATSYNGIVVQRGGGSIATNTGVGSGVLTLNTTGFGNLALGYFGLYSNTTGYYNTAVGYDALYSNTDGFENIGIGFRALYNNTTGDDNIAIGYRAGFGGSVNANTTGNNNIFIGYNVVGESATESNRTWIGSTTTTSTWLAGNLLVGTTTNSGFRADFVSASGYNVIVGRGASGSYFETYTTAGVRQASFGSESNGDVYIGSRSNNPILFLTNNTVQVRLFANGNLNIGSAGDTGQKLQVVGSTYLNGSLLNTASISGSYIATIRNSNTNAGTSFGLLVSGGTSENDAAFRVQNAAQNTNFFTVLGNGASTFSSSITATRGLFGTTTFNASAILQADSTTQGFLPPRMTAAQRAAITTPSVGLVVYQTDGTEGLYIYTNANGWKSLAIVN